MSNSRPTFRNTVTRGFLFIIGFNLFLILFVSTLFRPIFIEKLSDSYLTNLSNFIIDDIQYVLLVRDPELIQEYVDNINKFPWTQGVTLYSHDDQSLIISGSSNWNPNYLEALKSPVSNTAGSYSHYLVSIPVSGDSGISENEYILHLTIDSSVLASQVNTAYIWLVVSILIATAFLYVVVRRQSNQLSQGIENLSEQITSIDPNKIGAQHPDTSPDTRELANLQSTFHSLMASLSEVQSGQEQLVARRTAELSEALEFIRSQDATKSSLIMNLSHDLRTPLTSNRGNLDHVIELIEDGNSGADLDYEEVLHHLQISRNSSVVLSDEIDSLLQYASSTSLESDIVRYEFDIKLFVDKCLSSTQHLAQISNNSVAYQHSGKSTFKTSERLLQHILDNLLTNAHKYCNNGSVSVLSHISDDNSLSLVVSDDGVGIPDDEKEYIFLTHYQTANQRQSIAKGMGIGLSLTKLWVDKLGGEIALRDDTTASTVFVVRIPS